MCNEAVYLKEVVQSSSKMPGRGFEGLRKRRVRGQLHFLRLLV